MEYPIRVLQVVFQMNRAGLETMLMNYYRNFDRNKVQFDFLICHEGHFDYDAEIVELGGRIHHVPPISIKGLVHHLSALKQFFVIHPEYHIVHSHLDALSAFALYHAGIAGVPIRIAHSHNNGFDKDKKYPVRILAKKLIPFCATHFWACSEEALQFMFDMELSPQSNTAIIPNAIDFQKNRYCIEDRIKIRRQLGLEDQCVVGHIGRFTYQKNHDFLISIFASLCELHKNSVLILVGEGNELEKMKNKVKQLGLSERTKFLGTRSDVGSLYSAMDVFLLPSFFEGFGMVLLEAQVNGLPCIASDTVSASVNISGKIRWMSLKDSPQKWAKAVLSDYQASKDCRDEFHSLQARNYEIHVAAERLQQRYLSLFSACQQA